MRHVDIKSNHRKTFHNFLKRYNLDIPFGEPIESGNGFVDVRYYFEGPFSTTLKRVNELIQSPSSQGITKDDSLYAQYMMADILYSLWTRGILTIKGFRFPHRADWDAATNYLTVDHVAPKRWFPWKTFDVSNWEPETRTKNRKKGCKVLPYAEKAFDQYKSELDKLDEELRV